jgi:intracellular septation protein
MVVMPLVLLLQWVITRKLNKIYLASTALVLFLGMATLYFRNPLFLYWKPTVLNWAIALAFLGSQFIGDRPFVQRMMENAAQLTSAQWKRLNSIWVVFFMAVGCINLYVAFAFSEAIWVKFKLFGMFGITIIFVIIQTVWLTMAMKENGSVDQSSES